MTAIFTPDDAALLTVGRESGLRVHDAATGNVMIKLTPHREVCDIAISPDGSTLATIEDSEPVTIRKAMIRPPL